MTALSDDSRAILSELEQDATPTQTEAVADWLGISTDAVTECDLMRFLDYLRDEEETAHVP